MAGVLSTDSIGPGLGVARNIDPHRHHGSNRSHGYGSATDSDLSLSEEDDEGNSLTKQLAETAVGVRELSKQLGTYSVHSRGIL